MASKLIISSSFLHGRFLSMGLQHILYYKKSSVWLGMKALWPTFLSNIRWLVGNGNSIRFWKDNWLGEPIVDTCNIDLDCLGFLDDKVSDFIHNGSWNLPHSFLQMHPATSQGILAIPLLIENVPDQVVWAPSSSGSLVSSEAYEFLSSSLPSVVWGKHIWHATIQPRKSLAA